MNKKVNHEDIANFISIINKKKLNYDDCVLFSDVRNAIKHDETNTALFNLNKKMEEITSEFARDILYCEAILNSTVCLPYEKRILIYKRFPFYKYNMFVIKTLYEDMFDIPVYNDIESFIICLTLYFDVPVTDFKTFDKNMRNFIREENIDFKTFDVSQIKETSEDETITFTSDNDKLNNQKNKSLEFSLVKNGLYEYIRGCFRLNGRKDLSDRVNKLDSNLSKKFGFDIYYVNYDSIEYMIKVKTLENTMDETITLTEKEESSYKSLEKHQQYLICLVTLDEDNHYHYDYLRYDDNLNLESLNSNETFTRILK